MPQIELVTGAVAAGGGCVARADDGRVVFVRHALPGERVLAEVTGETSSYLRADAVAVLEASPDRVDPPCPHAGPGRCGGCDWQHVALPAQRRMKADLVAEQLTRLAGIRRDVVVEEVPGAEGGLGWRTRVRFAVDGAGRTGLRRHRSHAVEAVDRCLIAHPAVAAARVTTDRWPGAAELEVAASPDGGPPVVTVGTRPRSGPFHAPASYEGGLVVDGRPVRRPREVEHRVLGRRYRVSAGVFWQVHPGGAATLARAVLDGVRPRPGERVADLYAGAGLFAALLAREVGPAGSVVAVERSGRACRDAEHNTADLPQVTVRRAEVTAALVSDGLGAPDLVVLDPARDGAGRAVTAALVGLRPPPRCIAYVSCDPSSFARDLKVALDAGWAMSALRAFDLFPMTEHVELVALLSPPGSDPPGAQVSGTVTWSGRSDDDVPTDRV